MQAARAGVRVVGPLVKWGGLRIAGGAGDAGAFLFGMSVFFLELFLSSSLDVDPACDCDMASDAVLSAFSWSLLGSEVVQVRGEEAFIGAEATLSQLTPSGQREAPRTPE